jgi:hypothetical protein
MEIGKNPTPESRITLRLKQRIRYNDFEREKNARPLNRFVTIARSDCRVVQMAGVKGRSGPPGNQNNFKHGLAAIQKRREEGIPREHEESVKQQILQGLIADKGGDQQISTATRILAEVIASDASWLMVFNGAIDHIIQNNPKARQNPRGLSQLDG